MAPLEITPEDLERARVVNVALPGCANRDERVTVIAAALAAARAEALEQAAYYVTPAGRAAIDQNGSKES